MTIIYEEKLTTIRPRDPERAMAEAVAEVMDRDSEADRAEGLLELGRVAIDNDLAAGYLDFLYKFTSTREDEDYEGDFDGEDF